MSDYMPRIVDQEVNLLSFKNKIDTKSIDEPATLAIITGHGMSYRRDDGVHVVSISTLGP